MSTFIAIFICTTTFSVISVKKILIMINLKIGEQTTLSQKMA